MDNNAVIVQIIAVALILFFCFITYMNTKTWRVTHVVFAFLTFSSVFVFAVYASLVLKTRKAWNKTVEDLEVKVLASKSEGKLAKYGNPKAADTDLSGINAYSAEWYRTIADRGNVWRDCKFVESASVPAGPGKSFVSVKLDTTPEGILENQKVEPHKLTEKTVVYAFKMSAMNETFPPTYWYVGEFITEAVTDTSISLKSLAGLNEKEAAFVEGNDPWILYETMPIDNHAVFLRKIDTTPKAPEPKHEEIDLAAALSRGGWLPAGDDRLTAVIADYKRDGSEALDTDPPENVFAQVTFKQEFKLRVDAEAGAVSPFEGQNRLFNDNGETQYEVLRRGDTGEVVFKAGDTAEMIFEGNRDAQGNVRKGAKEYAEENVLEITKKVYRRKLNAYAEEFRAVEVRRTQVRERLAAVKARILIMEQEAKLAEDNTKYRNEENEKLLADLQKVDYEKAEMKKQVAKLDTHYRKLKNELSVIYRESLSLHSKIVAANDDLTREIEARGSAPVSTRP